jgi:hypothetical protein
MKDWEVRESLGNDVKASSLLSTIRLLDGLFDVDYQSTLAVPFRRHTSCTLEMETKWRGNREKMESKWRGRGGRRKGGWKRKRSECKGRPAWQEKRSCHRNKLP